MHAHRIKIFYRTNDHHIICGITQFQFKFFPAQHCFFYQYFMDGDACKPGSALHPVHLSCTKPPPVPPSVNEGRITKGKPISCANSFPSKMSWLFCRGNGYAHLYHPLPEFFPVFCFINRFDIYTDQLYIIFFPNAEVICFFAKIQCCLSAHGRQYCIDLIFFQDLFNTFYGKRQQIYPVSHHRVRHDGSRVAVDQDNFYAFFPKAACSLGTGIIKFAGLANNNRPASYN
jgi:hypothetical protein